MKRKTKPSVPSKIYESAWQRKGGEHKVETKRQKIQRIIEKESKEY